MADNQSIIQEDLEQAGIGFAPVNAIEAITRGEVDIQISTARSYPRSLERFLKRAKSMIGNDIGTAESCIYRLPRKQDGKTIYIEGESVRLAEIVAVCYGNLRAGGRVISIEEEFVVAQAVIHDLETNVAYSFENRRGIVTKNGRRFSNDMIVMTCNAAISIALRNSVFRVVPKALIKPLYEYAKGVAVGDETTLPDRRKRALAYFKSIGVSQDQVLQLLEKKGVEDIDLLDIERLVGVKTAIADGELKVADLFANASNGAAQANTAVIFKAPTPVSPPSDEQAQSAPEPTPDHQPAPEVKTPVVVETAAERAARRAEAEPQPTVNGGTLFNPPPSIPEATVHGGAH